MVLLSQQLVRRLHRLLHFGRQALPLLLGPGHRLVPAVQGLADLRGRRVRGQQRQHLGARVGGAELAGEIVQVFGQSDGLAHRAVQFRDGVEVSAGSFHGG
jgi:hypothetical protein